MLSQYIRIFLLSICILKEEISETGKIQGHPNFYCWITEWGKAKKSLAAEKMI